MIEMLNVETRPLFVFIPIELFFLQEMPSPQLLPEMNAFRSRRRNQEFTSYSPIAKIFLAVVYEAETV
jgi:hypothetical protein